MSHLHLALLGAPQVRHGQRPLSFRTRKGLALLIYLVVEEGMHTREKLATLFWPETDPSSGRANLRSTLMYLRKTLAHDEEDAPGHLLVERGALGFDRDVAYELDLDLVRRALEGPSPAPDRDNIRSSHSRDPVSVLQEAIAVARGEFLEGFSLPDAAEFDNWLTMQREGWHLRLSDCFNRLSQIQLDRGNVDAAAHTLQQWLALNPFEERAYRRLMRNQVQRGDRSGALQTFERCRDVLLAELGVEPSAETSALAQHIRTMPDGGSKLTSEEPAGAPSTTLQKSDVPLVGRDREHQILVDALRRAQREQTQTVIIKGEAGMGKTRLTREFLAWAAAAGARTLAGRAYETGGRLPYQAVAGALQTIKNVDLAPPWLAELSRLLPDLRDRYPDLPPAVDEGQAAPTRLFEAVTRLGLALTERKPLVLLIDDAQWADASSLDLLLYATRRWVEEAVPLLFLVTLRSESLAQIGEEARALRHWLHTLQQGDGSTLLELGPLDAAALQDLLQFLASGSQALGFSEWLYAETGGHPFYVTAMLETLLEEGLARRVQDAEGRWRLDLSALPRQEGVLPSLIPPGVRRLIRHRLDRLTDDAFHLLVAAAVLGQEASFRQLCHVAGQSAVDGLSALDQLTASRLLESKEEAQSATYRFSHDKIRDIVYTEAGDARRQLFHERAYSYLQESDARPARLAHHALAAGLAQPAFDWHLAAGEAALELFAVRDAIDFYEKALQVLDEEVHVTPSSQQIRQLHERLGRAYELNNRWQEARVEYQALLDYAQNEKLAEIEVSALGRLAGVAIRGQWQPEKALANLDKAEALAETQDDAEGLVEIISIKSQLLSLQFDRKRAVACGERALALARQSGQDALIARTLNYVAYARFGPPSMLRRVEAEAAEARDIFSRLGNRALEADSLAVVAHAQTHQGRPGEAVRNLRQAQKIVRQIENSWGQVNVSFHLAFALVEVDEPAEALEVIEEGMAVARRHDHHTLLANVFSTRGTVQRALGNLERARADHEEAQERFEQLPFTLLPAIIAVHLCADCALGERWQAAYDFARQSLAVEDLTWLWVWADAGFFYHDVVEALYRGGDDAAARDALTRFESATGDNPRYLRTLRRAQKALQTLSRQASER